MTSVNLFFISLSSIQFSLCCSAAEVTQSYLTARGLLEAAAQSILGGDRLVLWNLVGVMAGVDDIVTVVLDLLAALGVVVSVAGGRGGARLWILQLPSIVVEVVQLRYLVDLDRGLRRMFDVDVDNAGAVH